MKSEDPRSIVPDPGWTPGPAGSHELGAFRIEGPVALLTAGWSPPGPDKTLERTDDCLLLSLAPGRWIARLVVQPDATPSELASELAGHPDGRFLKSVFAVTYCRPWLVLAREGALVDLPRPDRAPSASALEEVQGRCDASGCDAVEALPLGMQVDAERAPLTCVGRLEPWTHRVAFVAGTSLSRDASASLESSVEHLACAWTWGLVYRCGRAGPLPVFAAGPGISSGVGGPDASWTALAVPGEV